MAKVFVGNLSASARDTAVRELFEKCGRIVQVVVKDGYGFVEYAEPSDADEAVKVLHRYSFLGKEIRVTKAHAEEAPRRPPYEITRSRSLYVGNINPDTTMDSLRAFFEQYGDVESIRVLPQRDGTTGISVFVNFYHEDAAAKVMSKPVRLQGHDLRIVYSNQKPRKSAHNRSPERRHGDSYRSRPISDESHSRRRSPSPRRRSPSPRRRSPSPRRSMPSPRRRSLSPKSRSHRPPSPRRSPRREMPSPHRSPRSSRPLSPRSSRGLSPRGNRPPSPRGSRPLSPRGSRPPSPRGSRGLSPRSSRGLSPRGSHRSPRRSPRRQVLSPRNHRVSSPRGRREPSPRREMMPSRRDPSPRGPRDAPVRRRSISPRGPRSPRRDSRFRRSPSPRQHSGSRTLASHARERW